MKSSKKKTYGVYGLMEWYCNIPCGGARVDIPFTGGTMSGRGTVPAQYTTENPFVQAVIENSNYFLKGRIVLLSESEGSGRYQIADPEESSQGTDTENHAAEVNPINTVTPIEVGSLDDAKEYLVNNYGYKASALRSKAAITAAAADHGIEFTGI